MSEYVMLEQEIKDMANTITKYLPRITLCLEEIALGEKIFYTEVKNTKMSYVITEDIAKIGKRLTEVKEFPTTELERI